MYLASIVVLSPDLLEWMKQGNGAFIHSGACQYSRQFVMMRLHNVLIDSLATRT